MSIPFADSIERVEVVPTGLFIDKLTGVSGIPKTKITEIFGDSGTGKSSLCLQIVAEAQKRGFKCLWADIEWSFSPDYAKALGVDNSKLGLIRERVSEDTLDMIEEAAESGDWDLIILDAIGGILPRADAEKRAGEKTIGSQAGLVSKFLRKIVPILVIKNVALIAINHSFVDIMSGKIKTSGGAKLEYHRSISIRLKQKFGVSLKQGDKKIGKIIIGEVKRNKVANTEGMELEGHMLYGTAFSVSADLMTEALEKGVIVKKVNSYYLGTQKLSTGLVRLRKAIEEDADLSERIKQALIK